jgi:hypothetical protein
MCVRKEIWSQWKQREGGKDLHLLQHNYVHCLISCHKSFFFDNASWNSLWYSITSRCLLIKPCQTLLSQSIQWRRSRNKRKALTIGLNNRNLMWGLKGRKQKNVGLLTRNMKINISCDGWKNIPHDTIGHCFLPAINTTKKVNPHGI